MTDGQDGEIWIRSRAICMGYLHDPARTAAEFHDGYWKSGDFGRFDANGYVYVLDRVKDTITRNGMNVYPSQVEAALSAHPKVLISAVIGISDPGCGEAPHAEVVLRKGECVAVEELRAFLAARLPGNDVPLTIDFASTLPISAVGKVLRRAVRDACMDRRVARD